MPVVKVKSGTHCRKEEGRLIQYRKGDRLEVTDGELKKFRDKFEVVSSVSAPEEEPKGDEDGGEQGEFDVETADVEALKAKAEELGVEIGPRWGERRIRDAVLEALEEGKED